MALLRSVAMPSRKKTWRKEMQKEKDGRAKTQLTLAEFLRLRREEARRGATAVREVLARATLRESLARCSLMAPTSSRTAG